MIGGSFGIRSMLLPPLTSNVSVPVSVVVFIGKAL